MKVTTNNGVGQNKDPNSGNSPGSSVDGNGKVTVQPQGGDGKGSGSPAERPSWLPAGFDKPEDLAAAYAKLAAPAKAEADKANEKKVEAAASAQKVDIASLEKEWRENGKSLKPDTLEKLKASGIGEEMISDYIASRQAAVDVFESGLAEHVGGKENLDTLLEFASKNLDEDTIERYNAKLTNTKSPKEAQEVLDLILKKYEDTYGKSGRSATAGGAEVSAPGGVEPIQDMQELTELMADPRYKKGNKAFHDMVEKRIKASPHLYGGG